MKRSGAPLDPPAPGAPGHLNPLDILKSGLNPACFGPQVRHAVGGGLETEELGVEARGCGRGKEVGV